MPFYDADISAIIQGPGNAFIDQDVVWEWDGHTFSVAVALEEIPQSNERTISYRFLGDCQLDAITSVILQVPNVQGEINFARVAACFFVDLNFPEETDHTFVEVVIVYQIEVNNDRDIEMIRMGFDPDDFVLDGNTIPVTEPVWTSDPYEIFDGVGADQIMPDVAYDPRSDLVDISGGNIYIVFTRYVDPFNAKIFGVELPRANPDGDPPLNVQGTLFLEPLFEQPVPFQIQTYHLNGFHPRMDIGFLSFPDEEIGLSEWKAGIAYTGDDERYHPRVIMFQLPPNDPELADNGIGFGPFVHNAGGMPTIDIGPFGTNYAAVAWSQSRSESWNDVTVALWDTMLNFYMLHPNSGVMSSASPSVSIHNRQPASDIYQTSVAFLSSPNCNSQSWQARAMLLEYDSDLDLFTPHLPTNLTPINFFGEFDSGSQYTNWYGLSSSITAYDNMFWALWSSIDQPAGQTALTQVHGVYGFTDP